MTTERKKDWRYEKRCRISEVRWDLTRFIEKDLKEKYPDLTLLELTTIFGEMIYRYNNDAVYASEKERSLKL